MPPTAAMINQLDQLQSRYAELGGLLVAPETITNPKLLREYGQEQSRLEQTVSLYRDLRRLDEELDGARSVLAESDDPELSELASDEIAELEEQVEQLTHDLRLAMLPPDPNDERAVIVEIRAGAGGEEASLFAAELYRMYVRFAERRRWKVDLVNLNETGIGGHKEAIFQVNGRGVYSQLKYESGVHRVQRVPTTEASGRIHTSTTTVAVLPVAEAVEVEIDPEDLIFETYRSSGHGGQSVNTTDSAVRITHRPTGMVVTCQDERSQLKNRLKALAVLRARLLDQQRRQRAVARGDARRSQIGSGDRNEKIRTYNFPQDRVTDHRVRLTTSNLPSILDGALDNLITTLAQADQAERLVAVG